MPLTPDQISVIKATIPVLKEGGVTLTTKFYENMLNEKPEVRPFFNPAHQASGMQPKALAHSLLLYATYIDDLGKLSDLVERIVSKHVTLLIQPDQYPIVGEYLIRTMKEVLGDLATDEVIGAWTAAYGDLANLLIDLEEKRYQSFEWRGFRQFTVSQKIKETPDVVSLILTPKDGHKIHKSAKPGQYLGIKLTDETAFSKFEGSIRREYSISDVSHDDHLRISVKRIPGGVASNYIHDNLKVGDVVDLTPPAGGLVYDAEENVPHKEVFLLAGGIGITPILPIAKQITSQFPNVKVTFVNSSHTPEDQPFVDEINNIVASSKNFEVVNFYSKVAGTTSPIKNSTVKTGHLIKEALDELVKDKENSLVYYLGPVSYMISIAKYLKELGIPENQTHREFFFPDQSLTIELSS
ncbi:hypothetical protein DV495_002664 [Geotrichum candidum]|nr:hypothetical protein DV454_002099 [Geotrichum candidum]KAF5129033.1 hypothetical protein DV495_002664 [Geotrichum candidum]KAI8132206.1 hypothetical protein DUD61_004136 [Geotrichum candidum]KAI9214543.1 hypothetical protein DS838_000622 [Geotrichum bryndzae]